MGYTMYSYDAGYGINPDASGNVPELPDGWPENFQYIDAVAHSMIIPRDNDYTYKRDEPRFCHNLFMVFSGMESGQGTDGVDDIKWDTHSPACMIKDSECFVQTEVVVMAI